MTCFQDLDASWNNITTINCFEFYGELKSLILDGNPLIGDRLNISGFHKLTFLSLNFVPTLENFHTSSLASVFDRKYLLNKRIPLNCQLMIALRSAMV